MFAVNALSFTAIPNGGSSQTRKKGSNDRCCPKHRQKKPKTELPESRCSLLISYKVFHVRSKSSQHKERSASFRTNLQPHAAKKNRKDSTLNQRQAMILSGQPFKPDCVPEEIKVFHSFRDKLAVFDEIAYRGSRQVVLKTAQPEILIKLHCSHQGTIATIKRARSAVYWSKDNKECPKKDERCVACAVDQPAKHKENIKHHDILGQPWIKVEMDILTHKDHLLLVEYFSDFFECELPSELQSRNVIKRCKKTYFRYGTPHQLHSYNKSQFTPAKLVSSFNEQSFQYSLPRHRQSNGAKAADEIIKKPLRRHNSTPKTGLTSSPAEIMFEQPRRSILPIVKTDVLIQKEHQKSEVQQQYNQSKRNLSQLAIGSHVLLKDFQSFKNQQIHG